MTPREIGLTKKTLHCFSVTLQLNETAIANKNILPQTIK